MTDTEWFPYGKDNVGVAIVNHEQKRWVPVADIAKATGVRKVTLFTVLNRNPEIFKPHERNIQLHTPGGVQEMRCIDGEGAALLLLSVSTGHIKNKDLKDRVNAYREWQVTKMLARPQVSKGGIITPPAQKRVTVTAAVREGKQIAKEAKMDARECVTRSLEQYGYGYYVDLLPPSHVLLPPKVGQHSFAKSQTTLAPERPLIETITGKDLAPRSPKPEGMLSATDIGKVIGKSAEQVNQWLYNNKFIVKDADNPGEWRTDGIDGKTFGIEVPYKPHPAGKRFYRVFWKPEILEKFNVKV